MSSDAGRGEAGGCPRPGRGSGSGNATAANSSTNWLEQAIATMYARLDPRRQALDWVEAAEQMFAAALPALVSDPEGARFVAQCLELDAVAVQRLMGRLDVS